MRYAYIGTVESKAKADYICGKHSNIEITGIDENGNYELSVRSDNDRVISIMQRKIAQNRM